MKFRPLQGCVHVQWSPRLRQSRLSRRNKTHEKWLRALKAIRRLCMSIGILDVNVDIADGRGLIPISSFAVETTEIVVQQNRRYSRGTQMKKAFSKKASPASIRFNPCIIFNTSPRSALAGLGIRAQQSSTVSGCLSGCNSPVMITRARATLRLLRTCSLTPNGWPSREK